MTGGSDKDRSDAATKRALALVTEALDLIDAHRGPPEAAAHLQMAVRALRDGVRGDGARD